MFVRVKSTPNSPRKSVQIVESVRMGDQIKQKIVRYVGIAMDDRELAALKQLAESICIKLEAGTQELLFSPEELAEVKKQKKIPPIYTDEDYRVNLKHLKEEQRVVDGIHDVYGQLFDELKLKTIFRNPARQVHAVETFKNIVMARLANPASKRQSTRMLEEDFGVSLKLDSVYRMMDQLDLEATEKLQSISYEETRSVLGGKIDIVFYDATTLYFESFEEDDLRRKGYSKDHKFNEVQVVVGLMVTSEGLPIGYELFPGDTFEGHTLISNLKRLREKYKIDRVIFAADSGMFNRINLAELERENFEYVVGARIKNMSAAMTDKILDLGNYTRLKEGTQVQTILHDGKRLIITHKAARAERDENLRKKMVEKLRKLYGRGKSKPNQFLKQHGHRKYLRFTGEGGFVINEEQISADQKWDGLHGVITNSSSLTAATILAHYAGLWEVEAAFRVTKHDLKVRPVFHWKESRVRAHVAIVFTAYMLAKHLEHRVRLQYKKLSIEMIRQFLIRSQTSILWDSTKRIRYALPSRIPIETQKIYNTQKINRNDIPYIIKKCSA